MPTQNPSVDEDDTAARNHEFEESVSRRACMPTLTRQTVDACAFNSWFPKFKGVTPKATIIPLEPEFIAYLKADGVFLPNSDESDEDSEFDPNGLKDIANDEDVQSPSRYDFQSLTDQIAKVIDKYEAVFPKLNWSSPQDAAWMVAGQPLRCQTPEDVYLLLKSSDFISYDIEHAYDECQGLELLSQQTSTSYYLVLKKWFSMPRSHEFRCFVKGRSLIAISQRDTNYYDFLQEPSRQNRFSSLICRFFKENVQNLFLESDHVFDIYITRDESKVFLIDFNPFAHRTDSLLFDWTELVSISEHIDHPKFRVIASEAQASQSMPRHSHNRYPKEVVGLSDGASIADFAKNWRNALDEVVQDSNVPSKAGYAEVPGR